MSSSSIAVSGSEPFHRPQAYEKFKIHLSSLGFTVYPVELDCVYSEHPFVDIAAKMGSYYWAFEYKSERDCISRGVEQVDCYRNWFDYVVLVSEKMLDHRRSENYWKLRKLGAGIWVYDPKNDKRIVKVSPEIQPGKRAGKRLVPRRFLALRQSSREHAVSVGLQTDLRDYFA